jgi:signal transduction histidine kinase
MRTAPVSSFPLHMGVGSPSEVSQRDEALDEISVVALRFAESLELPVVLEQVAQQVARLLKGTCRVRFAPPGRPADAWRAVATPDAARATLENVESEESYATWLGAQVLGAARLPGSDIATTAIQRDLAHSEEADEAGAALLLAPLIARGRRIGTLDIVLSGRDAVALAHEQRRLRALAAHAALALDTADQFMHCCQAEHSVGNLLTRDELNARLALIVHDLRSPLATLSSSLQLIARFARGEQELDRARMARMLGLATASVAQLDCQISALGADAVGTAHPLQSSDLVQIARGMAEFYQQTTVRHQLSVETAVPELTGMWARPHLERLLGNLFANGIKYSPAGSEIRISLDHEQDALGRWATLRVQNTGIGIAAHDLARLTQPHQRAQNVGAIAGTGLGLASVRAIVEQYGGVLTIESAPGAMTVVLIRLPL